MIPNDRLPENETHWVSVNETIRTHTRGDRAHAWAFRLEGCEG
jgi:hypothetical protein